MYRIFYDPATGYITEVERDSIGSAPLVDNYVNLDVFDIRDIDIKMVDLETKQIIDRPDAADILYQKQLAQVVNQRNVLLQASDWTEIASVQALHTEAWRTAWAQYRQDLRDITEQPDIFNIVWPTPPDIAN